MEIVKAKQKYITDMVGNKWFFHKKDLLSDRSVYSDGGFVVAWHKSYYSKIEGIMETCYVYTAFENHVSFITYLRQRCGGISAKQQYFEIIQGDQVQCFYVDIDYNFNKLKDFKYHDLSDINIQEDINIIIQAIVKMAFSLGAFKEQDKMGFEIDKHIFVYKTPGQNKRSYHILCKIGVYNNYENMVLLNILKLYLKEYGKEYLFECNIIDSGVYSKWQHFRMLGSNKAGQEDRIKEFKEKFPFGTSVISYKYPDNVKQPEEKLVHDYLMSFITNLDQLIMVAVPVEYRDRPSKRIYGISDYDIPQEQAVQIFDLLGNDKINFEIYNINGNIVNLKRMKSSWCEFHKRCHDNMPPFLSVQHNGNVYFYCNRPSYPRKLIGNINIQFGFDDKPKECSDETIEDIELCIDSLPGLPPKLTPIQDSSPYIPFNLKLIGIKLIDLSKLGINDIKYDLIKEVIPPDIDLKSIQEFIENPVELKELVKSEPKISLCDIRSIKLFATDHKIKFVDAIEYSGKSTINQLTLLEYLCKSFAFDASIAQYIIYDETGMIKKTSIEYLKSYIVPSIETSTGKSTNLYNIIKSDFRRFSVNGVSFKPYSPFEQHPVFDGRINLFSLPQWKIVTVYHKYVMELLWFHIRNVLCNGHEPSFKHLMACLATAVQFPRSPKRSAVVLLGKEGCGKSIFTSFIIKLFLPHSGRCDSFKSLTSNFNAHLDGKIYYIVDDSNPAENIDYEKLKSLITEEYQLFTNKGVDSRQGFNYCKYLITTNRHDILRYISKHERRFCFIECSDIVVGNYHYFKLLGELLSDKRVCDMFYTFLLQYDLTGIDIDNPPMTDLKETIIHNNDTLGDFVDYLNSKSWGLGDVPINYWDTIKVDSILLMEIYNNEFQYWKKKYQATFSCQKSVFSRYFGELYPRFYVKAGGNLYKLNIIALKSR